MSSPTLAFDPVAAIGYLGQTVLVELGWEEDSEVLWRCYHVVGVVLPVPGVFDDGYFLTISFGNSEDSPIETYFNNIHTIRVIHGRDRHASGKVLGSLPRPQLIQGTGAREEVRVHA
ncbi:hypothetical protein [Pseudomonas paralcaligenes]|uniref:hypothetical protein n=1 Tax=Pseudomonas paralcaligenes TaxID=2772558 RepID=UPI001C7E8E87|nr:hypothetical protein [Pseudomonas paralcaligenes]